jgi:proline-specific peptidase
MSGEGRIEVEDGFTIWYRVVGDGGGVPLLTLHGGPGAGHDYIDSLADLSVDRPVVFYDQLGCGRSDQPDDPSRWVIERFTREIDTVRSALGLDRVHLLGQSWGGWLAIEHMAAAPGGIQSLVLASTSASIAEFAAGCAALRAALPVDVREALERYEAVGDYEAEEYQAAVGEFYARHLCRLDEWPDSVMRTVANLDGNQVYLTMNGPNEFTTIGNLKDWDRSSSLGDIQVPTLITCGRFDEIGPSCAATLAAGIPDSRLVVFERSAHLAHVEERERYMQVLGEFLRDHDDRPPSVDRRTSDQPR